MDFKVIIYIIIGVLYFLYTIGKRAEEKKKNTATDDIPPVNRPVSPPVTNPMDDILREIKRKQAEAEAQRKLTQTRSQPKPQTKPTPVYKQTKPQKEILVREVKPATMVEGATDYEPIYQRELTSEEKLHNELQKTRKVYAAEEYTRTEEETAYEFDARQAFIGSVIFERKY